MAVSALAADSQILDTDQRLRYANGLQWVYHHRIDGISSPYAIYLKFAPGRAGGPIVVNVNSAYIKADFQRQGPEKCFDLLLLEASQGKIPGSDM
ncbi:MAG: hypothetical protein HY055_13885 [Magnetospirillum sp.]|nr:hypothetical protein [Magnetospirillum sp.]